MRNIRRKSLIYIFICLFCILPAYFQIGGVRASNVLALGFVLAWVLLTFTIKKIYLTNALLVSIIIWVILRLVTLISHGEISRMVVFLFSGPLLGMVIIPEIDDREKFLRAIDVIINTFAILAILGIIESLTRFNVFSLLNNSGADLNYNNARLGIVRIISFTGQTINYCLCCSIVAILVVYRITNTESRRRKLSLKLTYVLLCINIILTLSRSIIICFIVSQLVILYKMGMKILVKRILQIALILFAIGYIWSLIGGTDDNFIMQIVYMILAVFDERFADKLAVNWGKEDKTGVGDRVLLYSWVWSSMRNNLNNILLGVGEKLDFLYSYQNTDGIYSWTQTKNGIEVNYLSLMYHYGILGLISEIAVYIVLFVKGIIGSRNIQYDNGDKINFNYIFFVIILVNFMAWFGVGQGAEKPLLYIIIFLFLSYNYYGLWSEPDDIQEYYECDL